MSRTGNFLDEALQQRWKAQANNLIGGWCITLESEERTPADGGAEFADFMTEEMALHIVGLHNASVTP